MPAARLVTSFPGPCSAVCQFAKSTLSALPHLWHITGLAHNSMLGAGLCGPHQCSGLRTGTGSAPVRGATMLLTAEARESEHNPTGTDHRPEGTERLESTVAQ